MSPQSRLPAGGAGAGRQGQSQQAGPELEFRSPFCVLIAWAVAQRH